MTRETAQAWEEERAVVKGLLPLGGDAEKKKRRRRRWRKKTK